MQKRNMVSAGYRTYTGYVMNEYDAESYNYVQGRINACIGAGVPVSEELLNWSHRTMVYIAERTLSSD